MSRKVEKCTAEVKSSWSGALVGRFDHALDPKKRFTIPSEWRASLGNVVYVMPDRRERCLNLYSQEEMDVFLEQLRQKALLDPALNRAYQTIGAMSELLPFDGQGRIRVSDKLLQFANLTTTVAIVGSVRMLKVYNPAMLGPEDEIDIDGLDADLAAAGM